MMKFKLVLAILAVFMMAPHSWAEPWWENAQIQQTLTEKSIDQEVCGSGIDEDGVGGDAPCPGGDSDLDGYKDDVDCEPFNKFVYPGISTTCDINGGTANGWKTCQSDGTFTSCMDSAVQPLCEAQGDGHCYYFDPVNGDNSNDGSYEHPWRDYIKIDSDNPSQWWRDYINIDPDYPERYVAQPGDVFYFMSGRYEPEYPPELMNNADLGPYLDNNLNLADVGDLDGYPIILKNYPGEHPILVNRKKGDVNSTTLLYRTKNIIFEGFEIIQGASTSHTAIALTLAIKTIVRNVYLHDVTDDSTGDLTSCIFIGSSGPAEVKTSIFHDCCKTTSNPNSGEVFIDNLQTGKTLIAYNTIFMSKDFPKDNRNPFFIGTKHGSLEYNVELEIAYNIMYSPPMLHAAIASGQYNTYVHNNISFNKQQAFATADGGTEYYCYFCNMKFENNTAINSGYAFYGASSTFNDPAYDPDNRVDVPNPTSCDTALGTLDFNKNIITNSTHETSNSFFTGFLHFYSGFRDKFYEEFVMGNDLKIDNNVYYDHNTDLKTNTYAVSFFSASYDDGDKYGATYSINQWQTDTTTKPFNYDVHSFVEDPLLKTDDGSFMPQNPNAKDKGWLAGVTTEVIWDIDGDKKWSLPDIIYGLEVLAGKRK